MAQRGLKVFAKAFLPFNQATLALVHRRARTNGCVKKEIRH